MTSQAVREQHGNTVTWIENQPPDAVVFPQTTEDVQEIVRICAAHRVPVIPFGAGTSLEGHVNAPHGGVSIDFRDMNQVLAVHAEDLDCVVEPGITRKALNEYLRDQGVFFPIDPGADASLGGMAATRCSGTNAVRYGTMKDNVLALKVVMANGEVMTPRAAPRRSSAGYDLTRLMVGSEGTLGVITELTLKLSGIPEAISGGICPFPSVEACCNAAIHDHPVRHPGGAHRTARRAAGAGGQSLFQARAARDADAVPGVPRHARRASPSSRSGSARSPRNSAAARSNGRRSRRSAPGCGRRATTRRCRPSRCGRAPQMIADRCLRADLAAGRMRHRDPARHRGKPNLIAPIVGHVGDGNFHLTLLVDMDDADEVRRAKALRERLVERALAMDGTCTGEHGVGQGKMKYLLAEHGAPALAAMRAIKRALDPQDIMNPGKIVALS